MVAVVASAGLVGFLVHLAGADAFWAQAGAVDWVWVGLAGGLSLLLPLLRGLRFVSAMPRVALPLMTAVVGVQNFMARVMPFRSGELALPYLLQRHGAETSERSLVVLISSQSRFSLDFSFYFFFFLDSLLLLITFYLFYNCTILVLYDTIYFFN